MQCPPPRERGLLPALRLRAIAIGFKADKRGATLIEYALVTSIMAFALMAALPLFSSATGNLYSKVSNSMSNTP